MIDILRQAVGAEAPAAADPGMEPDDLPMTDAQADELKRLCEEANEPQSFDGELTRSEARDFIAAMRRKVAPAQ